ncbi:hypothetical protein CPB86DRAFT_778789 [Serendipita vermifera]|nr:hypothetical protein CPB86DRAFT_778789 [Serendipita vermifera]
MSNQDDPRMIIGRMNDRIPSDQPKITTTYQERGPDHAQEHKCTYMLGTDKIASGEWKSNQKDAKLSAATAAVPILRQWGHKG